MTGLQVDFWRLQETERSNKKSEEQRGLELQEATRHNKTTEAETERHNRETERIDWARVGETSRHNQVSEQQTAEYNTAWLTIQNRNADAQAQQAQVAAQRAANEARRIALEYSEFAWQRMMDSRQQGLRELSEWHDYEIRSENNEISRANMEAGIAFNSARIENEQRSLDIQEADLRRKKWETFFKGVSTASDSYDSFRDLWQNVAYYNTLK
jgi:multidrug efflux pump subunit AcrA (membrane-fusion protein)